jgi:hypothetical protein
MNNHNTQSGRSVQNTPTTNQSQNNKNRKRKRGPRKDTAVRTVPRNVVRDCTRHYLGALTDPFGYFQHNLEVCVPDNLARPSYKIAVRARGVASTGTSDFGYVSAQSFLGANNVRSIAASNASFSDPNTGSQTAFGIDPSYLSQLPYSAADIRQNRTVAAGLRVRYIGTELDMNGTILGVQSSSTVNPSLSGLTYADLASRPDVTVNHVSRKWTTISYKPIATSEDAWGDYVLPSATDYDMVIAWATDSSKSKLFEWEFVKYMEFIPYGAKLVPNTTRSHSDVEGVSAVRDYLANAWSSEPGQNLYRKGVDYVYNYLSGAAVSAVSPYLLTF